uniref:Uncharacterized protein n=1 Tax=Rhizophora mucronata TaxID=61149 RepID=A0A2P2QB09_RHIMU
MARHGQIGSTLSCIVRTTTRPESFGNRKFWLGMSSQAAAPNHVEKTRTTLLVLASLSKKIFLSMTCNLGRSPCSHKVSRNASPVSFPKLLKSN